MILLCAPDAREIHGEDLARISPAHGNISFFGVMAELAKCLPLDCRPLGEGHSRADGAVDQLRW